MPIIPSTQGSPQFSNIVTENALNMIGAASRQSGDDVLSFIDAELAKLFQDRNVMISDGGLITYNASFVLSFTEPLLLNIFQQINGAPSAAPTIISLGSASQTFANNGDILYAIINRTLGTATVALATPGAPTPTYVPELSSTEQEVFVIAVRSDSADATTRIYFRDGSAYNAGQSNRLGQGSSGGGGGGGGGGGASGSALTWSAPDGNGYASPSVTFSALKNYYFGQPSWTFPYSPNAVPGSVFASFLVPSSYVSGTTISMSFAITSPATSGTATLSATVYVIEPTYVFNDITSNSGGGTAPVTFSSSTTNTIIQTSIAIAPSGSINSIPVLAGYVINVYFSVNSTQPVYFLPGLTTVSM